MMQKVGKCSNALLRSRPPLAGGLIPMRPRAPGRVHASSKVVY